MVWIRDIELRRMWRLWQSGPADVFRRQLDGSFGQVLFQLQHSFT